ncbi:MAG: NADH-quinone oxidoreductase subunit N [Candidatus Kapaibacterium sp.]
MNIDFSQLAASFGHFIPEIILGSFFVVALMVDAFTKGSKKTIGVLALVGFVAAGVVAFNSVEPVGSAGDAAMKGFLFRAAHQVEGQGMLVVDNFALFFKILISVAAVLVVIFSLKSRELDVDGKPRMGEYYSLLLAMTFGMFLMVGANDLLLMYLGIEIVSLCSYAIVGFTKNVRRSSEASMKYVIYGGISSGVMLFGISLMYGMFGTTNFGEILTALGAHNRENVLINPLLISSIMILVGLGYKISAAPFHFWTPDVYEGAPITMTAFLSVASKAAGFALLIRFVSTAYPHALYGINMMGVLAAISVFTMTLGNLAALQQSNLKRLLAYSSIAHAGYMLMGLVVGTPYGIAAILVYFAVYLIMNLGAFFAIQKIAERVGSEELEDFKGLGPRMPLVGVLFSVMMVSLVGLPPTSGFIGKLFLFNALLSAGRGFLWLAVIGVINSVISLYYYIRVLKVMYLEKPSGEQPAITFDAGSIAILGVLALATLLLGLPNFFGPLLTIAQNSLGTLGHYLQVAGAGSGGGL